ncbi:hypothetical protein JZ751_006300, partial [Albula glossodonta]
MTQYREFKGRTILDKKKGDLTITGLTIEDSGLYRAELLKAGYLKYYDHEVKIIDAVTKPAVTCQIKNSTVTLRCAGDQSPLTQYSWVGPGIQNKPGSELQLNNEDIQNSTVYSCVVKNPVSNRREDFDAKTCLPAPGGSSAVITVLIIALILITIVLGLAFMYYKKYCKRNVKRKVQMFGGAGKWMRSPKKEDDEHANEEKSLLGPNKTADGSIGISQEESTAVHQGKGEVRETAEKSSLSQPLIHSTSGTVPFDYPGPPAPLTKPNKGGGSDEKRDGEREGEEDSTADSNQEPFKISSSPDAEENRKTDSPVHSETSNALPPNKQPIKSNAQSSVTPSAHDPNLSSTKVSGAESGSTAAEPNVDSADPNLSSTKAGGAESGSTAAEPNVDSADPNLSSTKAGGAESGSTAAEPNVDSADPNLSSTKADGAESGSTAEKPNENSADPNLSSTKVSGAESGSNAEKPNVDSADPNLSSTKAGGAESGSTAEKPNENSADPNLSSTKVSGAESGSNAEKPNVDSADPNLSSTKAGGAESGSTAEKPNVDSADPNLSSTKVSGAESGSTATKPNVDSADPNLSSTKADGAESGSNAEKPNVDSADPNLSSTKAG